MRTSLSRTLMVLAMAVVVVVVALPNGVVVVGMVRVLMGRRGGRLDTWMMVRIFRPPFLGIFQAPLTVRLEL